MRGRCRQGGREGSRKPSTHQGGSSTPSSSRSSQPNCGNSSYETPKGRSGGRRSSGFGATTSTTPPIRRPAGGGGSSGSKSAFNSRVHTFGSGIEKLSYEKEKSVFKVGPAEGSRFQLAGFLRGLSRFVEWKLGLQSKHISSLKEEGKKETAATPSLTVSSSYSIAAASNSNEDNEEVSSLKETTEYSCSYSMIKGEELATTVTEEKEENILSAPTDTTTARHQQRNWWPSLVDNENEYFIRNPVATREETEIINAALSNRINGPVELSLRLERLDLTDLEAEMLSKWVEISHKNGTACVRKLWLYGNRITDQGALSVARLLANGSFTECHLSHNVIGLAGAAKILESLPTTNSSSSPLWLRLEWNRISLNGLVNVLEEQFNKRGLLIDVPEPSRADAAPPLPRLPSYLAAEKANKSKDSVANTQSETPQRNTAFTRSARNQLHFIINECHCRLPWISSQFETPSEAAVLVNAKQLWSAAAGNSSSTITQEEGASNIDSSSLSATIKKDQGPLLLLPDTSALLGMLGAASSVTTCSGILTLEFLLELASQGLFGRQHVPASEQVFVVVPFSVSTQLDALKSDGGAKAAVRWFMAKGIDDMGPSGANFLTLLAAHEGEGLVLDHGAEVTGSRGGDVVSRGQAADHRIVEVGLFFQNECLGAMSSSGSGGGDQKNKEFLPIILLTADNGQAQLAKTHGLPAVKMSDMQNIQSRLLAHVDAGNVLSASFLRGLLRESATAGVGAVAARSLTTEFDGAVACLNAAVKALEKAKLREILILEALENENEEHVSPSVVEKIKDIVNQGEKEDEYGLLDGLKKRLEDWDVLVRSHQQASRVLKWSSSSGGGAL